MALSGDTCVHHIHENRAEWASKINIKFKPLWNRLYLENVTAGVAGEFHLMLESLKMSYRTRVCRTKLLHARQWDEEKLVNVAVTVSTK